MYINRKISQCYTCIYNVHVQTADHYNNNSKSIFCESCMTKVQLYYIWVLVRHTYYVGVLYYVQKHIDTCTQRVWHIVDSKEYNYYNRNTL